MCDLLAIRLLTLQYPRGEAGDRLHGPRPMAHDEMKSRVQRSPIRRVTDEKRPFQTTTAFSRSLFFSKFEKQTAVNLFAFLS